MKTSPNITIARKAGSATFFKRMAGVAKLSAYVGIPAAASRERSAQLLKMAGTVKSKKRKAKLQASASEAVNNAELLFIFSKGSPVNNQPARPVLEPAVAAEGNKQSIARELAASAKANLGGDRAKAVSNMQRAALAGQNAARTWFTDGRNNWAANAPRTVKAKGSERPGIDTGAMRAAIQGLVAEE